MRRRELLRTAAFAAGLPLLGGATAERATDVDGPWIRDWLPSSLTESDAAYSIGVAPTTNDRLIQEGDRYLHLLTDHATVTVADGVDTAAVRERLRASGYEHLDDPDLEYYGRSSRGRYRVAVLRDDAAVTARGPARGLVADRAAAVAETDGVSRLDGTVGRIVEQVGPGPYRSVDVRPVRGIAGVGERLTVGESRSRLQALAVESSADGQSADAYLRSLDGVDGVVSTARRRRGRAVLREATIETDVLGAHLEGSA